MGEEFPCASVAALDFVGYQQCAGCGGDFAQAAQEIIIDHADSCNSLNAFDDDGCEFL